MSDRPVNHLSKAAGERAAWGVHFLDATQQLFITNPSDIGVSLAAAAPRRFEASIRERDVFRPSAPAILSFAQVPLRLLIGNRWWIGADAWLQNRTHIRIANDVALFQEMSPTTGTRAHEWDIALIRSPIQVRTGSWVRSRALMIISRTARSASVIALPMRVVGSTNPDR